MDELDPRALVRKVRRARDRSIDELNLITVTKTVELTNERLTERLTPMTQDPMDTIAKDATVMMTLAQKYLPMEDPDADGMVRALDDARRVASRRTRVDVADLRVSADADTASSSSSGRVDGDVFLKDGLPNGTEVRMIKMWGEDEDGFEFADAYVAVTNAESIQTDVERLKRALEDACVVSAPGCVFLVVECDDVGYSDSDVPRECVELVGEENVTLLQSTRLLNRSAASEETETSEDSMLAWAEASADERAWASKLSKRLTEIIRTRAGALIEKYQPLRDAVTFWSVVGGDARTSSPPEESTAGGEESLPATTDQSMLGKIIYGAVEGVPRLGILGAASLAHRHAESNPELEASKLKMLVYGDSTKSFAAGTVLGLGGPLAAPITMIPALVLYFTIRMRLCVAICLLGGGNSALVPSTLAAGLLCFFSLDAMDVLTSRPSVEEFDLEDLMNDLEATNAFKGAEMFDGVDVDAEGQSLADALNEKLYRLGAEAKEKTNAAICAVLESGLVAKRAAQRRSAELSELVRAHVVRRGGTAGEANRHADVAFAKALALELYERMAASVFTAANTPILVAELVPAVSSYLTVRAATTAIKAFLPESLNEAADEIAREAVEGGDDEGESPSFGDEAAKTIKAATESTKRAAVALGDATSNAFSEMNKSFSRMFSSSSSTTMTTTPGDDQAN